MTADSSPLHAQKTVKSEEKEEVQIDPVKQALANYSIIGVNPWEPEKPCVPSAMHCGTDCTDGIQSLYGCPAICRSCSAS